MENDISIENSVIVSISVIVIPKLSNKEFHGNNSSPLRDISSYCAAHEES